MRLIQNNQWVFDLPNGMTLTVNSHEAAEWIDGLVKDGERLRAELAAAVKAHMATIEERDRLRELLRELRKVVHSSYAQKIDAALGGEKK